MPTSSLGPALLRAWKRRLSLLAPVISPPYKLQMPPPKRCKGESLANKHFFCRHSDHLKSSSAVHLSILYGTALILADGVIGRLCQTGITYSPSKLTSWCLSCFGPLPSLLPPCPPSFLSSFFPQWGPHIAKDQTFHRILNSSPSCIPGDLIALTTSLLYPISSDLFVLVPSQQHLNPLKFTNIKKKKPKKKNLSTLTQLFSANAFSLVSIS